MIIVGFNLVFYIVQLEPKQRRIYFTIYKGLVNEDLALSGSESTLSSKRFRVKDKISKSSYVYDRILIVHLVDV